MGKIIKITEEHIIVAEEDKSVKKIPLTAIDFTPKLNKRVEIYLLDDEFIVNEVENEKMETPPKRSYEADLESIRDKININIVNENKPQNINSNYSSNHQNVNTHYEQYSQGNVSKWGFVFMSLFLGGLGGNFFMLRKPLLGVLCIFFVWTYIPALIGLFHGIVALFKKPDHYGRIRM